jgi:hypothetical protein
MEVIEINLFHNADYNTDLTEEEMTMALQDFKGPPLAPTKWSAN